MVSIQLKKLQPFCFIPLFIAIYLLYCIVGDGFNTALDRLDVVSIATFDNYNAGKFVTLYLLSIGAGIVGAGLLVMFFSWLYDKSEKFRLMTKFLNPLCAIGILLIFFAYTSSTSSVGITFLIAVAAGYVFYMLLFQRKTIATKNQHLFLALAAIALTLSFLVREILLLFNFSVLPNIALVWFIVFLTTTIIFRYSIAKNATSSQRIFYISRPFFLLPLLSVLKNEIYLILNQRGIEIFSPTGWYLTGIFVILLFMLWLVFKKKRAISVRKEIYGYSFPLLLASLVAIGYYTPFLNSSNDFFELANSANALFKTVAGNAIPFVDYLSSHGLADIGCGELLYVLLNGFSGTVDYLLYDFVSLIVFYLICYYFLLRIFGKNPILFFLMLFFPYLWYIIPKAFAFAPCLLFLLHAYFQRPVLRNLLYVCLFAVFTVFCRFDLGLPCMLITMVLLIGYLIFRYSKKNLYNYFKTVGILLFAVACVGTVLYLRSPEQLISNMFQAKDYLSCNQAHAYSQIESSDVKANFYHYVLFPIAAGVMLILLLYLKKTKQIPLKTNFLWLSTLFFLLFYFFNFQRGLVRHSLFEGWGSFICMFFYLSAGLFVILLLSHKLLRFRIAIFLVFVTTLIYATRYPGVTKAEDLFYWLENAYKSVEKVEKLPAKTMRVLDAEEFADKNYNDLKRFFDTNFDTNATFIDFSNTPMLYFYLQREVPSYFCQYMQNTVTEFLQEENLKLLQTKNIPAVLFSNYPNTWLDRTDGVPNTLRYNIICKHIYDNYVPYAVLNKHTVWIKKGITLKNPVKDTSLSFAYEPQLYSLKKYPYLLGKHGNFPVEKYNFTKIHHRERVSVPDGITYENAWIYLKISNLPHDTKAKLSYYKDDVLMGSMEFDVLSGEENQRYVFPVNAQYNWYSGLADEIFIHLINVSADVTIDVSFFNNKHL